jgi:hypothetical protein
MPTNPRASVISLLAFVCCLWVVPSFAQQTADGMSYVLLPVFASSLPGAYGSTWETSFAAYNAGSEIALYMPLIISFPFDGFAQFAAGGGYRAAASPSQPGPRLFWVETPEIDRFHFSLRIRDRSRQSQSAGVDIPVVRESEFGPRVTLVDVPVDRAFRHSLRIYDPRPGDRVVRVRISEFVGSNAQREPQNVVVDEVLTLRGQRDPGIGIWDVPAFVELHNLTIAFPELDRFSSLRIDIDPNDSDGRLWAFVAITNNATQEVTVVTPQ